MKDQVAVIGVGCTKFGDLYDLGYEDLICEAAFQAYADAKIDPQDIQAAYLGTYMPGASGGATSTHCVKSHGACSGCAMSETRAWIA